jgi:hypothetical protein
MVNLIFREGEYYLNEVTGKKSPYFRFESRVPKYSVGQLVLVTHLGDFFFISDRILEERVIKYILEDIYLVKELDIFHFDDPLDIPSRIDPPNPFA